MTCTCNVNRDGSPAGGCSSLERIDTPNGPRVVEQPCEAHEDAAESAIDVARRELRERTLNAWKR